MHKITCLSDVMLFLNVHDWTIVVQKRKNDLVEKKIFSSQKQYVKYFIISPLLVFYILYVSLC